MSITKTFFNGAHLAILVYDVSASHTMDSLTKWLKEIRETAPKNCIICICANKIDLVHDEKQFKETGQKFAEKFFADHFFAVSAKTDQGLSEMFTKIAEEVDAKFSYEMREKLKRTSSIRLANRQST